jgi:hypothetical protein
MKISRSKEAAVANQQPVIINAESRDGNIIAPLSKGEVRRLRKGINKGRINKLELPYNAKTINAICRWSKPIADADLLPIAEVTPVIEATTTAIVSDLTPAPKKKAAKKPAKKTTKKAVKVE